MLIVCIRVSFGTIVDIIINVKQCMLLCFYCAHCERKLQDLVKFQLETLSLFFSLSLSLFLKLFLILGQREPHCSYKVVLINKVRVYSNCKNTGTHLF